MEQDFLYDRLNKIPHWFALKTRSRHEKKVELQLKQKGIECFYLCVNISSKKWRNNIT